MAPVLPVTIGVLVGAFPVELIDPTPPIHLLSTWFLLPIAQAPVVGIGIWLCWRAPVIFGHRKRKLIGYSLFFLPVCVAQSMVVQRMGLFVQDWDWRMFDLRVGLVGEVSMACNFYADVFFFSALIACLVLVRVVTGTTLHSEHKNPDCRAHVSIKGVLFATAFLAIVMAFYQHAERDYAYALRDFPPSPVNISKVLNIETPAITGVVTGLSIFMASRIRANRPLLSFSVGLFAVGLLLVPDVVRRWLLSSLLPDPSVNQLIPSVYALAGAISSLIVCVTCLHILKWRGLVVNVPPDQFPTALSVTQS